MLPALAQRALTAQRALHAAWPEKASEMGALARAELRERDAMWALALRACRSARAAHAACDWAHAQVWAADCAQGGAR
jgi:hypothetical protein